MVGVILITCNFRYEKRTTGYARHHDPRNSKGRAGVSIAAIIRRKSPLGGRNSRRALVGRSRRRCTPTCSRQTTISRRSWTSACAWGPGGWPPPRRWTPSPGSATSSPGWRLSGHGPGLLLLDGLMAVQTRVADRTVTELLGAGDLVQPLCQSIDDMIERDASWRVLTTSRFALLDDEFAQRVLPWPQIAQALLRRSERRAGDLAVLRAISCQPRLDVRLVLLLWHLAGRWGRVEPAGLAADAAHSRTGCWVSWSPPSGRPSPTPWHVSPEPGWSPARPATGTSTAASSSTSRR